MKKQLILLAAVITLAFAASDALAITTYSSQSAWAAAVSGITTIDFNSRSGNTYATLTEGAVTFDVPGFSTNYSDPLWVSTPGVYSGIDRALVGNYSGTTIRATFSPTTTAVGTDVNNLNQSDNVSVTLVKDGTSYIYSVPVTGIFSSTSFFGVTTDNGYISEIDFTPGVSWIGIDNFSYGSASSVPLPGALLLLGSGLAGLGAMKRRFVK